MVSPTPTRIFELLRAHEQTAALKAAIELGIFTAVAESGSTVAEIAAACGASERGTRILCDTLVVDGVLEKSDKKYLNTADAEMFLRRGSPAYMGGAAEFLCDPRISSSMMSNLTETVRKGGTLEGEGTVSPENPVWVAFARGMGPLMMPAAQQMAAFVPGSGPLRVLDIAAGHGFFGIQMALRNPGAEVTALDWAAVLEVAQENAQKFGVAARFRKIAGSAFDADFGTDYDVVLLTNFLHHFDAATNETLLRKVHAALKPGGKAITLEFSPEEDRVTPALAGRFALTMLFTTAAGDAYTYRELEAMLSNAGFASSENHKLETQQSVIISTK